MQWCSKVMLSLLYWHLLHSSLSEEINSKEILHCKKKKKTVSEMTVEIEIFSHCPGCYLGNFRVSPYNRKGEIITFPSESAASSFWSYGKLQCCIVLVVLDSCGVVYSNSLIPGPK